MRGSQKIGEGSQGSRKVKKNWQSSCYTRTVGNGTMSSCIFCLESNRCLESNEKLGQHLGQRDTIEKIVDNVSLPSLSFSLAEITTMLTRKR